MNKNFFKGNPYIPGEQVCEDGVIKLNANENPYPPSPLVEKVLEEFDTKILSSYPESNADMLLNELSAYYGVPEDSIFVGNGSDEVLAFSFRAFFNSGKEIKFPDKTYSFYPVWAEFYNIPYKKVRLNEEMEIDVSDYVDSGGIVIANPNAPSGKALPRSEIEKLLKMNSDHVVIIDEAYIDFGGDSCVELINKYDNLVVVQTFSKGRSLAGLRVGIAFASPQLVSVLRQVKDSFNSYSLDQLAIRCAIASIKDEKYFKDVIAKIKRTREEVREKLHETGLTVFPSECNFLLIKTTKAKKIYEYMKEKKILVRYFENMGNYLRVSIGTDEEMKEFLNIIKEADNVIQ